MNNYRMALGFSRWDLSQVKRVEGSPLTVFAQAALTWSDFPDSPCAPPAHWPLPREKYFLVTRGYQGLPPVTKTGLRVTSSYHGCARKGAVAHRPNPGRAGSVGTIGRAAKKHFFSEQSRHKRPNPWYQAPASSPLGVTSVNCRLLRAFQRAASTSRGPSAARGRSSLPSATCQRTRRATVAQGATPPGHGSKCQADVKV